MTGAAGTTIRHPKPSDNGLNQRPKETVGPGNRKSITFRTAVESRSQTWQAVQPGQDPPTMLRQIPRGGIMPVRHCLHITKLRMLVDLRLGPWARTLRGIQHGRGPICLGGRPYQGFLRGPSNGPRAGESIYRFVAQKGQVTPAVAGRVSLAKRAPYF